MYPVLIVCTLISLIPVIISMLLDEFLPQGSLWRVLIFVFDALFGIVLGTGFGYTLCQLLN